MSKIQTWKRITTDMGRRLAESLLYLICQRYKLESESQLSARRSRPLSAVFNMSKIQTWKRITTDGISGFKISVLYLICQRYKLESESQRWRPWSPATTAVFNMSKIQTWKRITTPALSLHRGGELYLICQRYKLESESQLSGLSYRAIVCCI